MFKRGIALAVVCVLLPPSVEARRHLGKHHEQHSRHNRHYVRPPVLHRSVDPIGDGEIHIRPEGLRPGFQVEYPPVDYPNATGTAVLDTIGRYRLDDRSRHTNCEDINENIILTSNDPHNTHGILRTKVPE